MNRFGLIAAAGFLALALTACGEQSKKKPVESNVNNAATQPAQTQPAGGEQKQ